MKKIGTGTRKVGTPRAKLTLKLGNIPLEGRLVRMADETQSGLSQFSPAGNPIGYKKIDKITGEEVAADQIVKGRKVGDTVVTFTEGELDNAYAARQEEVSQVCVEDIQDIPDTYIKSLYCFKPENDTFWNLIAGRLLAKKKQLRFIYVEGRQERSAVLQLNDNLGMVYVLHFPSEVAKIEPPQAPECKAELVESMDSLLDAMTGTLPDLEERKTAVIDALVEAKITGIPIASSVPVAKPAQKGKSVEELLKESIAIAKAK